MVFSVKGGTESSVQRLKYLNFGFNKGGLKLKFEILYKMFQNALNRHWAYVYFTYDIFCFHVSFSCFNLLIINTFKG